MSDKAAWILGVLLLAVWSGERAHRVWEFKRNLRSIRKASAADTIEHAFKAVNLSSLNPSTRDGWNWDFSKACCPDCRSQLFHPGPSGGEAHLIKCAGCGSKFWYGPPFTPKRLQNDDSLYRMNVFASLEDIA